VLEFLQSLDLELRSLPAVQRLDPKSSPLRQLIRRYLAALRESERHTAR
jgi:hypothetical protein